MARRIMLNGTSYFGQGAIQEIVNEIKNRHFKKALVTSTPDLFEFKVATKVTDLLDAAGIAYEVYDGIKPNPTIENVTAGVEACKASGADVIVAVGGGSPIDTSKAIATIITNPEFADVRSLEGLAPTKNPCLPIIAVTTTSGTAAEVTINYVITDVEKNRKFVCVDTGMDALVHAVEGYITKGAWELTDMLHLKAIEIIGRSLRSAVAGDYAGREAMSLGQYIAGMGFSNVGLGIVHSMAHPLSAVYDIPHGKACAMLLTAVLKFNAPATGEKYREIARVMGVPNVDAMDEATYRQAAIDVIQKLADDVGIPKSLSEAGVKREDIPFLAESAFNDACTPGNPRDASLEEIIGIYESIF
ncbi:MAG: iron-containing alcohol dehydrogenase [Veillonella sp.]|nr:iron-containing alcohol dehydrogenase [Veillonella sp.]